MIISQHAGQPVKIVFAMVGKGKAVHYSTGNDDTLCGKGVSRYVDGNTDAALCKPCARIERVKSAEYAEWLTTQQTNAETDMIVSDDAAETSLMIAETLGGVAIAGDEPNTWAPDFTASGASECYFTSSTCEGAPVAVFVDYVGRTEGVCVAHRDRVEGKTYELPTVSTGDAESVSYPAPVIANGTDTRFMTSEEKAEAFARVEREWEEQNARSQEMINAPESDWMYRANGLTEESTIPAHVFVPGMHALDMGSSAYNRFVGIGESQGVPGSLFTYGLATAISAHPGMGGTGKINRECEFGDVITVRTSLGDVRYVVADNRYGTDGPRKGDPILYPYALEDAQCYVCQTHGDNSAPGQNVSGEWVCGFCLAFDVTPEKLNSHALSFYVETERAGIKFECDQCGAIDSRHGFGRIMCEGIESDAPKLSILDLVPSEKISALAAHIVETQHNVNTCDAFECERCAGVLYARCQESHTGTECVACAAYERFGFLVIYRGTDAFESVSADSMATVAALSTGAGFHTVTEDDTDGGFVETIDTMEYRLSVVVDESTGATVDLGWVMLDMNRAQAHDHARIADAYGKAHGTGTPRHGWESIIIVHEICAV